MHALIKKYQGQKLSTDEAAKAHNAIEKARNELENFEPETGHDLLALKWGTLKRWDFTENPEAIILMEKYNNIGSSISAMTQRDTVEQKKIICQLIDLCDGVIYSDWSGEYMTKQQAKDYVMEYDNESKL
jgi:hypothetical protein